MQTLEQVESAIKRWRTRLKRAMTMIEKLERKRKRLERGASIPRCARKDAVRPSPGPAPLQTVAQIPAEGEKQLKSFDEPAKLKMDDGLDIPAYLDRKLSAPGFNKYEAEHKAQKEKKAKAAANKRKGIEKERKQLESIPKSKRRWDTNKSQWIAD